MKTTKETSKKEERGELKALFGLWKRVSKNKLNYLSGLTENKESLVGYYNTSKKNAKEPDIRIYTSKDGQEQLEVASLWSNVSKEDKEYFTGRTNENERIIGFINESANEDNKQPYIRVYLTNEK